VRLGIRGCISNLIDIVTQVPVGVLPTGQTATLSSIRYPAGPGQVTGDVGREL